MAAAERKQISVEEPKQPAAAGASEAASGSAEPPKGGAPSPAPAPVAEAAQESAEVSYIVAAGQCLTCTPDRKPIHEGEAVTAEQLEDPTYFTVLVERGTIVLKAT